MSIQTDSFASRQKAFSFDKRLILIGLIVVALLALLVVATQSGVFTSTTADNQSGEVVITGEFSGGTYTFRCTPDPNSTEDSPRSFWHFTANFFTGTAVSHNEGNAPHQGGCPPGLDQANNLHEAILNLLRGDAQMRANYSEALSDIAWEIVQLILGI